MQMLQAVYFLSADAHHREAVLGRSNTQFATLDMTPTSDQRYNGTCNFHYAEPCGEAVVLILILCTARKVSTWRSAEP